MTAVVSVQAVNQFLNENLDIVSLESKSIEKMIASGLGNDEIFRFLSETTDGYSEAIEKKFTGFYGVFNGKYLDASGWEPEDDYIPEERPWYISAAEHPGETCMTSPYIDAQTGKVMISISRMFPDGKNVIAADISLQKLQELISKISAKEYVHCVILDNNGLVIASSFSDEGCNYLEGSSGSDRKYLAEKVLNSETDSFEMRFREKKSVVFNGDFSNGWHSVIIMNKFSLFWDTYTNMLIIALVTIAIMLTVFYYINASEQKQNEAYKSLNRSKAVSSIYVSVNEINLKDLTYDFIYSYEHVRNALGEGNYKADEAINKVMRTLVTEDYIDSVLDFVNLTTVADRLCGIKTITQEFIGKRLGWCRARFIVEECSPDGKPSVVLFAVEDINAAKLAEEKLKSESTVDNLTGCLNRKAFDDRIKFYHENAMEDNLVYISADVNGLKNVNDDFGHAAGDELIAGAAYCLKKVLCDYGDVFRTGGDEFFAIIKADKNEVEEVLKKAEQMCGEWSGKYINSVSVSAGYAAHSDYPDISISELGKIADKNMYDAKSRYYMKKGIDRRAQQDAYAAICASYEKIVLINLSDDSFRTVHVKEEELTEEEGFRDRHSEWTMEIAKSGLIHEDDADVYLKNVNVDFLREYFSSDNKILSFRYRRKINGEYCNVLTEIVRSDKYTEKDKFVYLYVKNIE